MTPRTAAVTALALCTAAPFALAQDEDTPASVRPGFSLSNRQNEDWSNFEPST